VIRPGEIYAADFDVMEPHRVIVISREELNRGDYVLVVFCTSRKFALRSRLKNCVAFKAGQFGFSKDSVAQCENLLSIEKTRLDLDRGPVGVLDELSTGDVIKAIGHVIESDCEPV
jgi:mRNA-degrading endonuclease toxin of MazEF toxin-antitoxin module